MKPILYNINTFDATTDNTFRFVWEGNQSFGNRCIIRTNDTKNTIVYSQSVTSMRLEHTITANTLKNGTWYNVVIASIDIGGNISEDSEPIVFYCLTTPVLTFTNIPNNTVLKNASYKVTMTYTQAENELLESYEISLYDQSKSLLQTSGVVYSSSNMEYTLTNLEDDQYYYIRGTCRTINGMEGTTDYIFISVDYEYPDYYALLTLENIEDSGYIKLQSNIRAVEASVNGVPIFIDGEYIDLRNNVLTINKDYALDSDYVIKLDGYSMSGLIVEIGNDIKIYYTTENGESFLELYCPMLNTKYYCQSNKLSNVSSSEELSIIIKKKYGVFNLELNRK